MSPIDTAIFEFIGKNPKSTLKTPALMELFQKMAKGNPATCSTRLTLHLVKLFKEGKLDRKRVGAGRGNGGTKWVYAYSVVKPPGEK